MSTKLQLTIPSSLKLFLPLAARIPHSFGLSSTLLATLGPPFCKSSASQNVGLQLVLVLIPFFLLNCLQVLLSGPVALMFKYCLSLQRHLYCQLWPLPWPGVPAQQPTWCLQLDFQLVVSNSTYSIQISWFSPTCLTTPLLLSFSVNPHVPRCSSHTVHA